MERKTRQREVIEGVFAEEARPLSPREILNLSRGKISGLGMATVYRALKDLLDEKWLVAVEVPGLPAFYEIENRRHHHHFHCNRCGRVFELEGCVPVESLTPDGFKVSSHEIILWGQCLGCAQ